MNLTAAEYRRLTQPANGHAARNAANQQEGATFQSRLDSYHEELRLTGRGIVYRTNPDIRVTGPGRAAITGKGPVDYIAFLSRGPVVHFDAKSRAGDAFSIGADMEHQIAWLNLMNLYGHRAGLLVWWKDVQECRWHPVHTFDKRVRLEAGTPVDGIEWLKLFWSDSSGTHTEAQEAGQLYSEGCAL